MSNGVARHFASFGQRDEFAARAAFRRVLRGQAGILGVGSFPISHPILSRCCTDSGPFLYSRAIPLCCRRPARGAPRSYPAPVRAGCPSPAEEPRQSPSRSVRASAPSLSRLHFCRPSSIPPRSPPAPVTPAKFCFCAQYPQYTRICLDCQCFAEMLAGYPPPLRRKHAGTIPKTGLAKGKSCFWCLVGDSNPGHPA